MATNSTALVAEASRELLQSTDASVRGAADTLFHYIAYLELELKVAQAHDQRRKCAGCGYAWATHHVAVGILRPDSNEVACACFLPDEISG